MFSTIDTARPHCKTAEMFWVAIAIAVGAGIWVAIYGGGKRQKRD